MRHGVTGLWADGRRWLPWAAGALVVFGPGAVAQVQAGWWEYRLTRQVRELQAVREDLSREHDQLESDPVYVEGLIRTTFKVANPDELVVILGEDSRAPRSRRVAGR
jgi:hypothetical protein